MASVNNLSLSAKIFIAMILGAITGLALNVLDSPEWTRLWLTDGVFQVVGQIFINLLKMLVVPLVFISLVCGSSSLSDPKMLGRVGGKTIALYLFTTAIAVSLDSFECQDFSVATSFVRKFYPKVIEQGLPEGVSLNINVPAVSRKEIKGAVVTRQGKSRVIETFDKRVDPRNNTYYWLAGEMKFNEVEEGTDCEMVAENYISITPIHFDLTHFKTLETLREWKFEF